MNATTAVVPRLCAMMFLQFFIWGSWFVTVGNFIGTVSWGSSTAETVTKWVYTVGPIMAIVSPMFLGVIADRLFSTQRVLAVMHGIGAALMFAIPALTAGEAPESNVFLWVVALYMLCYMPTLGLTNSLAFHNLSNQERQFPVVRVFGTLGWIAANFTISYVLGGDRDAVQFQLAGGASALMAVYCLSLPNTPPPLRGEPLRLGAIFGIDAIVLLKQPAFAVFMVASFLVCIPLAAYYAWAPVFIGESGFDKVAYYMSFGQWAEVGFMLVMPWFFSRLGVKWMIAAGMSAWVLRYGLFATAADQHVLWMIMGGILLHGICYDFFFVTGQIYVDKFAPAKIRGQAQGFLVLMTQGFGLGIGAQLMGELVEGQKTDGGHDWATIWILPATGAAVILALFLLLFRPGPRQTA